MVCRVLLVGLLMLGVLVAAPPVVTAQVACGSVISQSTGLTEDLNCSSYCGDPLHIAGNNVEFKLNGHTLTCGGQYNCPLDLEGIVVDGGSGVKILGPGKITNCGRAVTFSGGNGHLVQGLYMTGNWGGPTFIGGANHVARNNIVARNLIGGMGMSASSNILIEGNYIVANGGYVGSNQPNVGHGISNDNTSAATIANNYIVGNDNGGIREVGASNLSAQITNNTILNAGTDLELRGGNFVLTDNICVTSTRGGCPHPLPPFPATLPTAVGVFRPSDGTFYLDKNGSGTWEGCGTDSCLQIGQSGDVALVGDWTGNGKSKIGLFRPADGTFYLDYNGNGQWDGCGIDRCLRFGLTGDLPFVGDWNASGTSKVGAFRPTDGTFYLDYNGNGIWEGCAIDRCLQIGLDGDIPVVGKW